MSTKPPNKIYHPKHRSWWPKHECVICGSAAIGINFGAPTCAPCKAFFRRNARRKEIFQMPCPFRDSNLPNGITTASNETAEYCTQVRYCSSCRLRRCFDMGMKEELVRTDEENERYRQLVQANRRRRQQLIALDESQDSLTIPRPIVNDCDLLNEEEWTHLGNVVNAYETYCLKSYIERRPKLFVNPLPMQDNPNLKINYHATTTVNNIESFRTFLTSIPPVQNLLQSDRLFLCRHNIRPLILLNLHELEQLCYSEPWQVSLDNVAAEYICGNQLFPEFMNTKVRAEQILITDPVVTRLWLLILYFSTPLHCYYEPTLPDVDTSRRHELISIQNSYITLLWKYLCHRHGDLQAIRIFLNLNSVYLRMQRISQAVNAEIRTRNDLAELNAAFNRAVVIESDYK